MHRGERFDQGGYAGFDTERHVSRRLSSWDEAGWRSLFVQRFDHRPATDVINLPASSDHHFWETPGRHLTRWRVREAARLLDAGRTVTAVAAQCGFSSPSHLSTAFLREFGARPSQYRLRSQG